MEVRVEWHICHETLTKCCLFHTNEAAVFKVLYCILPEILKGLLHKQGNLL